MEYLQGVIIGFGYAGVGGAIFAESGLFFGAFLPGDSLLFTVGLLASQEHFNIAILWAIVVTMAILGDNVGYMFGKMVGKRIFTKEDSFFFRKSHVLKAQTFYEAHGKKAIVMARFVPIIRTFAPIVAGVAHMEYHTFFAFNVIGGVLWGTLLLFSGYFVGQYVPNAGHYLEWIIIAIILLSILPIAIEYYRVRKK
ncbi:MAG: hypothetical protein A2845_05140 [Candidatus Lloydbacteria bacterium RIFCSPHIGHO2_01_FULL_49_22]|uniref:VTT domain-containing protein n=1 Tax=Candidatus Lloydbacteria bacterium RIFCSPHIGHO2_01_FULL_49_22 TaxID=1798658 RepID=A0A1G2CWI0_9BACT|nr:MAG: hypothetical protein A2845_05140 [Candidatus Lloydbacteria bacterium RIFCSPHIGHO2_01_FULL_49_22]OGZ09513.1 MAG: hypothetical protein A3C14_01695 [Candidatus Lloydbacteria bacterium RIFCSPHIGHO2_02_FULL_50_18]